MEKLIVFYKAAVINFGRKKNATNFRRSMHSHRFTFFILITLTKIKHFAVKSLFSPYIAIKKWPNMIRYTVQGVPKNPKTIEITMQ